MATIAAPSPAAWSDSMATWEEAVVGSMSHSAPVQYVPVAYARGSPDRGNRRGAILIYRSQVYSSRSAVHGSTLDARNAGP